MHKSWVCMTIISTNIMQSLSHTHSITVLIQAPLDRDKTCSESLAAYLKMPYPELLECHEVLHFTQYVFFPTSVWSYYLSSCLSFIQSLHRPIYKVHKF